MHGALAAALVAVSLAVAGCGADGGGDTDVGEAGSNPVRETEPGEPLAPTSVVVNLSALDDSGPRGTATLAPLTAGGETRVTIRLADASGGEQPASVRSGHCETAGELLEELEPVRDGTSDSTLEQSLEELVDAEAEPRVVWVGPEDGEPVACGPLPERTRR